MAGQPEPYVVAQEIAQELRQLAVMRFPVNQTVELVIQLKHLFLARIHAQPPDFLFYGPEIFEPLGSDTIHGPYAGLILEYGSYFSYVFHPVQRQGAHYEM